MGGPCRLRLEMDAGADAAAAIEAAVTEVARLERKFSRYREDSLTSQINAAAGSGRPTAIDSETVAILNYVDTAWHESGGLFDISSGILRRAWDFKSGRCPTQAELDQLLPLIGWQYVQRDDSSVYLPRQGMELDFGGCVKEYAVDSAAAKLRGMGVSAALVDLAGDMVATAVPQGKRGWPVGIRHPVDRSGAIASVALPQGALASSGDYERCIEIDGVRYGHILDPTTGWPVRGLVAVSVLAGQCLVAGSAATIAMVKPAAEGLAWLERLGLPWLAVDADLNCHGTLL